MGATFGLLGISALILGVIFLIWPKPLRGIGGRKVAAVVGAAGILCFFVGVAITPAGHRGAAAAASRLVASPSPPAAVPEVGVETPSSSWSASAFAKVLDDEGFSGADRGFGPVVSEGSRHYQMIPSEGGRRTFAAFVDGGDHVSAIELKDAGDVDVGFDATTMVDLALPRATPDALRIAAFTTLDGLVEDHKSASFTSAGVVFTTIAHKGGRYTIKATPAA